MSKNIDNNIRLFLYPCFFREDPFNLYEANCGFYAELEEDCCKDLNHIQFPIFNPLKVYYLLVLVKKVVNDPLL